MILRLVLSCILIVHVLACSKPEKAQPSIDTLKVAKVNVLVEPPKPENVLRDPIKAGVIRVLTLHSINSFFVFDGRPMGIEYEILKHYADSKKLALEVVAVHHYQELYDSLATGNYDAVIGTILSNRVWRAALSETVPIYNVDVLLVSNDSLKLKDSVQVINSSPLAFWEVEEDSSQLNQPVKLISENTSKEQALALVAINKLPNILVDHHEYKIMEAFFPQLNATRVVSKEQPVSFSFHPTLHGMRDEFNTWFARWKEKKSEYGWIFKKYRSMLEANKKRMQYEKPELILGRISKYDDLVKNYSQVNDFDWLLVSALIYQESRFRPEVESPVGARGLMQLMPSVATTYRVDFNRLKEPRKNVELGTKYLRKLYDYYDKDSTLTTENKIKFTLASYNAGLGHIIDARALAQKHKYDPNVWDNHVALMLTQKHLGEFYRDPVVKYGHFRGWETFGYVQNIMMYYEHYQIYLDKYFDAGAE